MQAGTVESQEQHAKTYSMVPGTGQQDHSKRNRACMSAVLQRRQGSASWRWQTPTAPMRSVRTSSRTRVLYGIGIAIVGGEASQLILWSHFVMSNIISRLSCGPLHDASKFC